MLPDSYISNVEGKLLLYQKVAEIDNEKDLYQFDLDLVDRFGTLPKEAINLSKSISLKWLAADIGFEKIVMKNEVFLDYFRGILRISSIRKIDSETLLII